MAVSGIDRLRLGCRRSLPFLARRSLPGNRLYFPDSLATTAKEKAHWLRFWEDQGVQRSRVDLVTNLDDPNDLETGNRAAHPQLSVLGIVWNKVDDIMHGMQLRTAGMHNQVRLWALARSPAATPTAAS